MIQESRGRDRPDDVSLTSCEHAWQHMSSHEDVRHHVDFPDTLPVGIFSLWTAADRDARIGAEDVDPSVSRLDLTGEAFDIGLARHVALERLCVDVLRYAGGALAIDVRDDEGLR